MLKNWTVTTEATRDVMAREHYLINESHRNHKHTEKIISIFGSETQSLNILRNCERYKLKQASKRQGGRPPTEAVEFCLTLPKGVRLTQRQWRQILNKLMFTLAIHLDVPTSKLAPIVRAVLPQQNHDVAIKGTGDHMHVVIGKFTNDLIYLAELQRKSTTRLLKTAYNNAVYEVVGISHKSYRLQKGYDGIAKKRAPSWSVKAARKQEVIKQQGRQLKRIIAQANKWLSAFDTNDQKQMNRQYNRLCEELSNLESANSET
ncbi:hypothetical protein LNR29_000256 [Vibrio parahaemolyticus]|uniref:hypothetical protein n=1 Tax=Vibrio parahaemolyticus TaxID=670 RepID=UPI001122ED32|nr:hypothetical protein [Vibrio parahaemolyticus]EGR1584003.1 hypothetical protein [Vibrio parahaemolyticus]EHK5157451.1 hypothetical protein [Vibrio parahaemolyticus]EHZ7318777.1 hypothetical protein [Vibrio parahaemolyticus]EIA4664300.1 hypothetical protein [Vibrio parahaemolyticus]EIC2729428.1 hypothetical protein [Vibrio parahaemolyticus]